MFSNWKNKFNIRQLSSELKNLFNSSTTDFQSNKVQSLKIASLATGTGVGGLLLAYYGFKDEKEKQQGPNLTKQRFYHKFNLYASAKARRVSG